MTNVKVCITSNTAAEWVPAEGDGATLPTMDRTKPNSWTREIGGNCAENSPSIRVTTEGEGGSKNKKTNKYGKRTVLGNTKWKVKGKERSKRGGLAVVCQKEKQSATLDSVWVLCPLRETWRWEVLISVVIPCLLLKSEGRLGWSLLAWKGQQV